MARYDFICDWEVHNFLPVLKDGKWGLVSKDDFDKEIVAPTWDTQPAEDGNYICVEDEGRLGLLNRNGEEILPVIYGDICVVSDNKIVVRRIDGKCGMLNAKGKEVIPLVYTYLNYYSDKMVIAGNITINQNQVVPFMYDDIIRERNEMLIVQKDGLYGVITTSNETILDCVFENVECYLDRIKAIKNGKAGLYTYDGKEIIAPTEYDDMLVYNDGLCAVAKGSLWGIVGLDGNVIMPCKYQEINLYQSDEHIVVTNAHGKDGLTDRAGNVICEPTYDCIGRCVEGMFAVRQNGKTGFINKDGKLVVPAIYDTYKEFHNGCAPVARNGKWTLVDTQGKELLPAVYDSIDIEDTNIRVTYKHERGYVKL